MALIKALNLNENLSLLCMPFKDMMIIGLTHSGLHLHITSHVFSDFTEGLMYTQMQRWLKFEKEEQHLLP